MRGFLYGYKSVVNRVGNTAGGGENTAARLGEEKSFKFVGGNLVRVGVYKITLAAAEPNTTLLQFYRAAAERLRCGRGKQRAQGRGKNSFKFPHTYIIAFAERARQGPKAQTRTEKEPRPFLGPVA